MSVSTEVAGIRRERERQFEQNRRFEEITDLAERVGFPIETSIFYELRGESLYALTDTKSRAFIEQTAQAKQEGLFAFTGDQAFEAVRRSHEHDEAVFVEQFAKGEVAGNVLVKVSKVPDAVVEGRTSIKGYKRDTLRTFIRIYNRDGSHVRCKLFSIDHNDRDGLNRIGDLIGMQLTGRSSEDILADSVLFDVEDADIFADELSDSILQAYDSAIHDRSGETTRGGSPFANELDAQSAVEAQTHLLREHFDAISAIVGMSLNKMAEEDLLETERQRTAAAISLATRGHEVGSTGDAAVSAEVAQGDFSRDCPTATDNAMQQGENEMLKDWVKVIEKCPKCNQAKVLAQKSGEIISGSCGCHLNVCTGEYWKVSKPTKAQTPKGDAMPPATQEKKVDKQRFIKKLYGEKAVLQTQGVIGGVKYTVNNKDTGKLIDDNSRSIEALFTLAA